MNMLKIIIAHLITLNLVAESLPLSHVLLQPEALPSEFLNTDTLYVRSIKNKTFAYIKVIRKAEVGSLYVHCDAIIDHNLRVNDDLSVQGTTNLTSLTVNGPAAVESLTVNGVPITGFTDTLSLRTLRLLEDPINGTDAITLQAPDSLPADIQFTLPGNVGLPGQILATDGLNPATLSWTFAGAGGGDVLSTGNFVSTTMLLGTLNAFDLDLITNGSPRISISSSGAITLNGFGAGVLQTNSSGVISTSNGTNGQVLIGGGAAPAWANITPGSGISITNGAHSITIATAGTVASSFPTDGPTATPSGGSLSILGTNHISTNGLGSTVTVTSDATSANTINTLVARDGSGNFTAGTITGATGLVATSGGLTVSAGGAVIMGIDGATVGASSAVLVNSVGKLGTLVSSRRYKDAINDIDNITQNFMQLRPVSFVYKNDPTNTKQYGLIAEEVEPLFPDLLVYTPEGMPQTVQYHLLYAHFIKMIQEQQRALTHYQAKLHDTTITIENLNNRIVCLEETLQKMNIDNMS